MENKTSGLAIVEGLDDLVCVCHNYVVAAAISESTGYKVIVAADQDDISRCVEKAQIEYNHLLLCADNNPESLKIASAVKKTFGVPFIFPKQRDFHDMVMEEGYDAVAQAVMQGEVSQPYKKDSDVEASPDTFRLPGILQDIADYYTATAPKPQPLFAVATALAIGSIVMGRRYTTGPHDNYSSLYIVVAAKSGTGKDHIKQVCRNILKECGLEWMERGEGYTAANTVVKALERQPLQLTFFEEIGQKLQESAANPRSMAKGTFRKLLDVWSSCHSFCVGEEFSDGSIPRVDRPALTMVGLTTPKAFTDGVTRQMIEHGFVNRILPFISRSERSPSPLKHKRIDPPKKIIDFIKGMTIKGNLATNGIPYCPGIEDEVIIPFTEEALLFLDDLDVDVVEMCNALEARGLEDMPTRMREQAMRVSLIFAGFSSSSNIGLTHVEAAWRLVNYLYSDYISEVKRNVAGSVYEEQKLTALQHLRKMSPGGISPKALAKTPPWSKWPKKLRQEILEDLEDAKLIELAHIKTGKRGVVPAVWMAIGD